MKGEEGQWLYNKFYVFFCICLETVKQEPVGEEEEEEEEDDDDDDDDEDEEEEDAEMDVDRNEDSLQNGDEPTETKRSLRTTRQSKVCNSILKFGF